MCRNIKTLFNFDPPATDEEITGASLQFVRKLSGFTYALEGQRTGVQSRRRGSLCRGQESASFAGHQRNAARSRSRSRTRSRQSFGKIRLGDLTWPAT
jgi:hypothetical protein